MYKRYLYAVKNSTWEGLGFASNNKSNGISVVSQYPRHEHETQFFSTKLKNKVGKYSWWPTEHSTLKVILAYQGFNQLIVIQKSNMMNQLQCTGWKRKIPWVLTAIPCYCIRLK